MNQKIEITNEQWLDTQRKLTKMEDDIETIKSQLQTQQSDLEKIEGNVMAYRFEINKAIKEEIKPITKQLIKLSEENDELSKEIIKNAHEKYKIVAVAAGSLVMVILTYLVTLFITNLMQM